MVNIMKRTKFKSLLTGAALAAALAAPSAVLADPIEYIFDITYQGESVPDQNAGTLGFTIIGFGTFSFWSEEVFDFGSNSSVSLSSANTTGSKYQATFGIQVEDNLPDVDKYSVNNLAGNWISLLPMDF